MGHTLGALAGITLLAVGIANTILMLEIMGGHHASEGLRRTHRFLGWIFVAGFAAFFVYMAARIAHMNSFAPHTLFHVFAAATVFPLVLAKPFVARRYRLHAGHLPAMGFAIVTGTFVIMIFSAAHTVIEAIVQ